MNYTVERIKQAVTVSDCCRTYGVRLDRKGYACCPFHSEKTASFSTYANGTRFHCFGCGADGDVIGFIRQMFGLDFRQAIVKIDADFGLNITGERPLKAEISETRRKAFEKEQRKRDLLKRISTLGEKFREYRHIILFDVPCNPEQPSEQFLRALADIGGIEYAIEEAEAELWTLKTTKL